MWTWLLELLPDNDQTPKVAQLVKSPAMQETQLENMPLYVKPPFNLSAACTKRTKEIPVHLRLFNKDNGSS